MKIIHVIDDDGFYLEDMVVDENETINCNYVEVKPPSFFKAKWIPKEQKWVEGVDKNYLNEKAMLQSLQPKIEEIEKAEFEIKILNLLTEVGLLN